MRVIYKGEQELLEKLKAKDAQAFAQFYANHVDRAYAYALMILKSPDLAQDVVQDSFVKLWEQAELLDSSRPAAPYLLTIVRNKALNVIRRASKEEHITEQISKFALDSAETGMEYTERRQTEQLLDKAVQHLPDKRKEIYELCHQDGYSYKQAAEKLGLSYATVNSQMVKAIRTIREFMVRNGALLLLLFTKF